MFGKKKTGPKSQSPFVFSFLLEQSAVGTVRPVAMAEHGHQFQVDIGRDRPNETGGTRTP